MMSFSVAQGRKFVMPQESRIPHQVGVDTKTLHDARMEITGQAVRGLFLINGGGAVALLAFLQEIRGTDPRVNSLSALGAYVVDGRLGIGSPGKLRAYGVFLGASRRKTERAPKPIG